MTAPYRISRSQRQGAVAAPVSGQEQLRDYLDRLMRMIPGEVVGLYLVGNGIIPPAEGGVQAVWAVVCLIGVIFTRLFGTADPANNRPAQVPVVAISSVAFAIWVYSLGGPFATYGIHVPYLGSLLVLAWTFFVPLFYKGPVE